MTPNIETLSIIKQSMYNCEIQTHSTEHNDTQHYNT
jgi:hypothetical protein